MMISEWITNTIPDLTDKIAIVTGANSGIGYETARALAGRNAAVILACRDESKASSALQQIKQENPVAKAEFVQLDLTDLASVRRFAGEFAKRHDRLDMLINNAGVMMTPLGKTVDGFERQFGTNHLGHFALTCLLLDLILHTPLARVVTVSSAGHRFGKMDFDNLNGERGYAPARAYAQSKLANLLFTYELQRRLESTEADAIAVAAHPGWTATNLAVHWPMVRILSPLIGQKSEMGALPTIYAAAAPGVRGGSYYGPGGWQELRGYPTKVQSSARSHSASDAARLWAISEELTGVQYLWPVGHKTS
jgi:NAD(P)-dependent dehydrogenase (short-subunit alcohol dehydrogenase family)